MREPMNESENQPDLTPPFLSENQCIVGLTKHSRTGAHIVWMSLEGNDVTPVGAWKDEATAAPMVEETAHEFHRMVDAMDRAAPRHEGDAGFGHWSAFLSEMKGRSDADTTPFDDAQLAIIGENIAAMMEQKQAAPDAPDGFARVLLYSEAALQGSVMPRVRFAPMAMPPKRKGQNKTKQPPSIPSSPDNPSSTSPVPLAPVVPVAPIYLSYTDADGVAPFFQVLDGEAGLALVKASAPIMKRTATVLHTSGKAGDAPLEIVCVTDTAINQKQAEGISQQAINFAMETGLIPMQRADGHDEPKRGPQGFSPN